jgi:LmbE family N-acetylglucosaminyl deacetylase
MRKILFIFFIFFSFSAQIFPQNSPKVLVAIAHPDDDATFAGAVYKITHDLKGKVDYLLVTNGEGGYKYSTLAEDFYGLELTDEETGRKYLPEIRKKELKAGGDIIGVRNYYFLEQKDHKYTNNIREVLDSVWNVDYVKSQMRELIEREGYDYVFVLIPTETTHAHHSSVGILMLETANEMPASTRPVVLGGSSKNKNDTTNFVYRGLKEFPLTSFMDDSLIFTFDRTTPFGFNDRLNYKIIVNWLIAEHKSQGTMQLGMNYGDYERYYFFDMNDKSKIQPTKELFEKLKEVTFKKKEYQD